MIPRSRQDLLDRHEPLARIAAQTVGLMGRTPGYLNVTFAGFAGRPDEWGAAGNEEGVSHLVAFQQEMAKRDLCLTQTIVHPPLIGPRATSPSSATTSLSARSARHRRGSW